MASSSAEIGRASLANGLAENIDCKILVIIDIHAIYELLSFS